METHTMPETKIMTSFIKFHTRTSSALLAVLILSGCGQGKRSVKAQKAARKEREAITTKPTKQIKHMSTEEAVSAANYYEVYHNTDAVIATYQHIISKATDAEIAAEYSIKLADLHLGLANFTEAKKQYKRAITLYPGYHTIERARYREILSHHWSALTPARDQAPTRTVIQLGTSYLKDYPEGTSVEQVRDIIGNSYINLLSSELLIIKFYLHRYHLFGKEKALVAAAQRIHDVHTVLMPKMVSYKPEVEKLAQKLDFDLDDIEALLEEQKAAAVEKSLLEKAALIERFLVGPQRESTTSQQWRDRF